MEKLEIGSKSCLRAGALSGTAAPALPSPLPSTSLRTGCHLPQWGRLLVEDLEIGKDRELLPYSCCSLFPSAAAGFFSRIVRMGFSCIPVRDVFFIRSLNYTC